MDSPARLLCLSAALAAACDAGPPQPPSPAEAPRLRVGAPLATAFCTAVVEGKGSRDTETDYIPHVLRCASGGADLQALKAQAIAARSVLYYFMATKGSICDGEGCQVYACGASPSPIHYQAAAETAGQYLAFAGTLTYGFHVDGDPTPDPVTCEGMADQPDEHYVTYNAGKTGDAVRQTPLGQVGPPGFGQNRGCMARRGARCLEDTQGEGHLDILRFYYGADIQVSTAPGRCDGCEPGCDGTKFVRADCSEGDCAAFAAACVDDELGPRCEFSACPAQGAVKVCVDVNTVGDCQDGQLSTGDCSAFAAHCSTSAGPTARCVSYFCAEPGDTPVAHDGCFVDGQPFHCDDLGGLTTSDCPAGQRCSVHPEYGCYADLPCPAEGQAAVCMDAAVIGHCYGGGVYKTVDCSLQGGACATLNGVAACVPGVCVDEPGAVPTDHDTCLADGSVAHCFADGTLTASPCPPGLACVQSGEQARCGDEPAGSGGAETGDTHGDDDTGAAPTEAPPSSADASTHADADADAEPGCGCTGPTGPHGAVLVALALLGRRRRA